MKLYTRYGFEQTNTVACHSSRGPLSRLHDLQSLFRTNADRSPKATAGVQHATPVKNLLFLTRPEFSSQAGCVLRRFQYKRGHTVIFVLKSSLKFSTAKFLSVVAYRTRVNTTTTTTTQRPFQALPSAADGGYKKSSACESGPDRALAYISFGPTFPAEDPRRKKNKQMMRQPAQLQAPPP